MVIECIKKDTWKHPHQHFGRTPSSMITGNKTSTDKHEKHSMFSRCKTQDYCQSVEFYLYIPTCDGGSLALLPSAKH